MNQTQKATAAIMEREVTRKEFIAALGLGAASIMGFSTVIKLVTGKSIDSHLKLDQKVEPKTDSRAGYGASPYGI
jgi:hypothetical protein